MLSIKECQTVELEIMKKFHSFCVKHDLRYIMAFGTLLGAVRHQGFIPWDNDMDIAMPRPDYEKLLELAKTTSLGENLYLLHYSTDPMYHYQAIRICDDRTKVVPPYIRDQPAKMGVWVDIYPVDGVWEKPILHPVQQLRLKFNKIVQIGDIYAMPGRKGIKAKIKYIMHLIFPVKNNIHAYALDHAACVCSYEAHKYVGITVERLPVNKFTQKDFDHPILMQFEDAFFYAPQSWDDCLNFEYGNYMELPPEEKRLTHDLRAKWIESEIK